MQKLSGTFLSSSSIARMKLAVTLILGAADLASQAVGARIDVRREGHLFEALVGQGFGEMGLTIVVVVFVVVENLEYLSWEDLNK